MLPADLITEETIATLYDHLKGAAATAKDLLATAELTEEQQDELNSIRDGWAYCQKILLQGIEPERER